MTNRLDSQKTTFSFSSQLSLPFHSLSTLTELLQRRKNFIQPFSEQERNKIKDEAQTNHSLVVCIKLKHFFFVSIENLEKGAERGKKIVDQQQQPAVGVVKKFTCIFKKACRQLQSPATYFASALLSSLHLVRWKL
jgi:hypothetical protein